MSDDAEKQKVIIFTHHFEIKGYMSIYQGVRLTDYMNESKAFISVTDAEVKHHQHNGAPPMKAAFLNVRKDDIEIVVPEDAIK
ncbi:MAG: hypothetical protein C4518_03685 [Desulfobacteraceae bacterium]|nr:MAG: hypothetical protein C4518_03685 [Desulfobacteraceae bacterium]